MTKDIAEEMGERFIEAWHRAAEDRRFCGRCQTWLPNAIEVHHCVKAPRLIGYAWHEPDEPAFEKNSILTDGRKFKRGDLIERRNADTRCSGVVKEE